MSGTISLNYFDTYVANYASLTPPFTTDGGYYIPFTNQTSQSSVKGQIVLLSDTTSNCVLLSSSTYTARKTVGAFAETGIANGTSVKVAVMGKMPLLLKDGVSASVGDKLIRGTTAGRVEIGVSTYDVGNVNFVGYALESATGGTNVTVLAYVPMK